jgi:hypothetical protein
VTRHAAHDDAVLLDATAVVVAAVVVAAVVVVVVVVVVVAVAVAVFDALVYCYVSAGVDGAKDRA